MKLMRDQSKFYGLLNLLCDDMMLQVTVSIDEGIWSFNFYDHPDNDEVLSWDVKGKDPNKALIEFIPVLIVHFKKLRKIRKKDLETECVEWLDKAIKKLEWFEKFHEIM